VLTSEVGHWLESGGNRSGLMEGLLELLPVNDTIVVAVKGIKIHDDEM